MGIDASIIKAVKDILKSHTGKNFVDDTIIGSDINQIRHLFHYLKAEKIRIVFTYILDEYITTVESLSDFSVTFRIPKFEDSPVRRCRLKFEALGVFYQFEVALAEVNRDVVTIKIPHFIQSMQPRKYKRVPLDDIFMKFTINYRPFFISSADVQTVTTRYPAIIEELKKDEPDVYLINHVVTEELNKISEDFEMKFYDEKEERSDLENLISTEHKTFFINDTSNLENYLVMNPNHNLINYYPLYKKMLRGGGSEDVKKYFNTIQKEDIRNFYNSYIYSPLYILNRSVGHVSLHSSVLGKKIIRNDQAHQVHLLTGLLSYAMSKVVLAMSYYKHSLTRIMNISMGGMLFELREKDIFDFLIFNENLKFIIQLKNNIIQMSGEIARSFPGGEGYCIGVNFHHASGDDFLHLEDYLYSKTKERYLLKMH